MTLLSVRSSVIPDMLGAAGAVEAVAVTQAMQTGQAHPSCLLHADA